MWPPKRGSSEFRTILYLCVCERDVSICGDVGVGWWSRPAVFRQCVRARVCYRWEGNLAPNGWGRRDECDLFFSHDLFFFFLEKTYFPAQRVPMR